MTGCPVVPMVDDPMTARCYELPLCIWPWGRGHLARGGRAGARLVGGAASSRAKSRPSGSAGGLARLLQGRGREG